MVVAVAFSCVSPERVSVRGIVVCPQRETRLLRGRLDAMRKKPLDRGAVEEWGTGRDWIEKHFHFVDTSPPSIEFAPFALKRYFAFARVRNAGVDRHGLGI